MNSINSLRTSILPYLHTLIGTILVITLVITGMYFYQQRLISSTHDKMYNFHMYSSNIALSIREAITRTEIRTQKKSNQDEFNLPVSDENIIDNLFVELISYANSLLVRQKKYSDSEFEIITQQLFYQTEYVISKTAKSNRDYTFNSVYYDLMNIYNRSHQLEKLHAYKINEIRDNLEHASNVNTKIFAIVTIISLLAGAYLIFKMLNGIKHLYERKAHAESEIRKLNDDLEKRVEQRTEELINANTHLENSLQQLKIAQHQLVQSEKMASLGGMVAGVAHEINTPVGVGITAITHLESKLNIYNNLYSKNELSRENFEKFMSTAIEAVDIIHNNLNRAADLIRSFKQVAVDQMSNELREFNLYDYLSEVIQSLKPNLKTGGHQIELNCPADITMYSHPGALAQILTNLVMNSITHGFENRLNGVITISVHEDEPIYITYCDDGQGMLAETIDKVFEPFYTTRRNQGGTGLGMHISYNLATQTLCGHIQCKSIPGQGACFELTIPKRIRIPSDQLHA